MPTLEPETADRLKYRTRRLMKRLALVSVAVGLIAATIVVLADPDPTIHLALATFILAAGSLITASGLMTLLYYSANSGHDADAHDANPLKDDDQQ